MAEPPQHLVFPGYGDSDAGHWQSLWQADLGCARVQPSSWDEPTPDDWVAALDASMVPGTVVLAHSLGCLATIAWLERNPGIAAGAFLVAVPDPQGPDFPSAIRGFSRPRSPLADPTMIVGSADDPYASPAYTTAVADATGSALEWLTDAGHVNASSGFGPWPEGRRLLAAFVAGLGGRQVAAG